MITRRRLLLTLSAFVSHVSALAQFPRRRRPPAPVQHLYPVYIGVDTKTGTGKGLYLSTFDTLTGKLTPPILVAETPSPSFFAISTTNGRRVLYAGNETPDATSSVTSFLIDPKSPATLHQIGKVSSAFPGPCYVSVDTTGHSAFVADYAGSGIASFRVLPDGTLSEPVERISFKDAAKFGHTGPKPEQDAPHPHCVTVSPDDRFLVVCDLGTDHISIFSINPVTANLETSEPFLFSNNRPGSGPRHVAFHPNGRWLYVINELDSTIDHFLFTTTHSQNSPQALLVMAGAPVQTLAENFPSDKKNNAAEILFAPNGNFLYVSNRGEDSLVVFTVDGATGALKYLQRISCGGRKPRHFTLDPTGNWILCGNQNSDSITVFRRDPISGELTGPVFTLPADDPLYTLFA